MCLWLKYNQANRAHCIGIFVPMLGIVYCMSGCIISALWLLLKLRLSVITLKFLLCCSIVMFGILFIDSIQRILYFFMEDPATQGAYNLL